MAGNFNLSDYVQVNERIEEFYKKYPEGSIQTEITSNTDGQVIIKAYVYRNGEDKIPCTGHAMEKEGSTFINKTSHIENCETSAVGRALAMMGFEIKKSVASREEVENAKLNQGTTKNDIDTHNAKATANKTPEEETNDIVELGKKHGYAVGDIKMLILHTYKKILAIESLDLAQKAVIQEKIISGAK